MNKVALIGRLTRDPELRYTQQGTPVAGFTLAVNRRYTKEDEQKADFISIVAWQKTAEFCAKYFVKGQQVAVCGRIQTRSWDDQDGKKRYTTEVVAEDVYFADSKKSGQAENQRSDQVQQVSVMPKDNFFDDDEDDSMPF